MKHLSILSVLVLTTLVLSACTSSPKHTKSRHYGYAITPPSVVKAPDFRNLPTDSCKNGETIQSPVKLSLNKQGKVTDVLNLQIKDKTLTKEIIKEFKKAKYTPYLKNGEPIAHHLDAAIHLKCPRRPRG